MVRIYPALDDSNSELVVNRCRQALSINTPYKVECLSIISRQYFELQLYNEAKTIYLEY
jgi:hypothetical protein